MTPSTVLRTKAAMIAASAALDPYVRPGETGDDALARLARGLEHIRRLVAGMTMTLGLPLPQVVVALPGDLMSPPEPVFVPPGVDLFVQDHGWGDKIETAELNPGRMSCPRPHPPYAYVPRDGADGPHVLLAVRGPFPADERSTDAAPEAHPA